MKHTIYGWNPNPFHDLPSRLRYNHVTNGIGDHKIILKSAPSEKSTRDLYTELTITETTVFETEESNVKPTNKMLIDYLPRCYLSIEPGFAKKVEIDVIDKYQEFNEEYHIEIPGKRALFTVDSDLSELVKYAFVPEFPGDKHNYASIRFERICFALEDKTQFTYNMPVDVLMDF